MNSCSNNKKGKVLNYIDFGISPRELSRYESCKQTEMTSDHHFGHFFSIAQSVIYALLSLDIGPIASWKYWTRFIFFDDEQLMMIEQIAK